MNFRSAGRDVSGVQNDLRFDATTPIIACQTNPELSNGFSGFHIEQTGMRAVIAGLDAIPIPDGAVLYTCTVAVSEDAAPGIYPLRISNTIGSDPYGNRVDLGGQDGAVVVEPSTDGTPIPTRTPLPTPTPTVAIPSDLVVTLSASSVSGNPGDDVRLSVSYASSGPGIVSLQNDLISLPSAFIIADAEGRPDCQVNPAIHARDVAFRFPALYCPPGSACTTVRAQIFKADLDPTGVLLYTCTLHIAADAPPGRYPVLVQNASTSTTDGVPFPVVTVDAEVIVTDPPGGGKTTSDSTQSGAAAPASQAAGDGCAMQPRGASRDRAASQILFLGLLGLIAARRRHGRRPRRERR